MPETKSAKELKDNYIASIDENLSWIKRACVLIPSYIKKSEPLDKVASAKIAIERMKETFAIIEREFNVKEL